MKIKKYLLQFEFEEGTRWLFSDGATARTLQLVGENVAACHTTGPRPRVTVTVEEGSTHANAVPEAEHAI